MSRRIFCGRCGDHTRHREDPETGTLDCLLCKIRKPTPLETNVSASNGGVSR